MSVAAAVATGRYCTLHTPSLAGILLLLCTTATHTGHAQGVTTAANGKAIYRGLISNSARA